MLSKAFKTLARIRGVNRGTLASKKMMAPRARIKGKLFKSLPRLRCWLLQRPQIKMGNALDDCSVVMSH